MSEIVTLKEREARLLADRRAALVRLERRLSEAAARYGGRYLLFGSAARGEMRPDSDVDLLADFSRQNVSQAIRAAEDACEELGLRCDIVDRSWCSPAFLGRVLPGAKVLG